MEKKIKLICASLMVDPNGNGFTKSMEEVFDCRMLNCGHLNFNQELLSMTEEFQPELIFIQTQTEGVLHLQTVQKLAKKTFLMQFSGDIRHASPPEFYLDLAKAGVNLSVFTNMKDVRGTMARGYAAQWLEIGYDPEKYRTHDNPLKAPEIVAHFNDYGDDYFPLSSYRRQIVERLQLEFGPRFGVYGNFKGALGNFNSDQVMESRNYNGAKIAINCSHFFCEKYSSDRMLRILGSGVFCLSHHFPAISQMYTVGEHLDTFLSIDHLVSKCRYWLSNEAERAKVAAAGQKFVSETFTFRHMAEHIKSLYLEYNGKSKKVSLPET